MTRNGCTLLLTVLAIVALSAPVWAQPLGSLRPAQRHGQNWELEGVTAEAFYLGYQPDDGEAGQTGGAGGLAGGYEKTYGQGPFAWNFGIQLGVGALVIDADSSAWDGMLTVVNLIAPARFLVFFDETFAVYVGGAVGWEYLAGTDDFDDGTGIVSVTVKATYAVVRLLLGARLYVGNVAFFAELTPAYHIGTDLEYTADNVTYTAPEPTNLAVFGVRFGLIINLS